MSFKLVAPSSKWWQTQKLTKEQLAILEADFAHCIVRQRRERSGVMGSVIAYDSNNNLIPLVLTRVMNNEGTDTWKNLYDSLIDDANVITFTDGAKGEPAAHAASFNDTNKFLDAKHFKETSLKAGLKKDIMVLKAAMDARTQKEFDAAIKYLSKKVRTREEIINHTQHRHIIGYQVFKEQG